MFLSVFEMFKVGIGPSSSHTMGPMVAAARFLDMMRASPFEFAGVKASLHGSLAFTGVGHATDRATILGLAGFLPDTYDNDNADAILTTMRETNTLSPADLPTLNFNPKTDLIFDYDTQLDGHANGMVLMATDKQGDVTLSQVFYSIGGGFVMTEQELAAGKATDEGTPVPFPFKSATEMLKMSNASGKTIAAMKRSNEEARGGAANLKKGSARLWQVMNDCINRGLETDGILPGGLNVKRRAKGIHDALLAERGMNQQAPHTINDWMSVYAMAVNEENAAGGQVVTAPHKRGCRRVASHSALLPRPRTRCIKIPYRRFPADCCRNWGSCEIQRLYLWGRSGVSGRSGVCCSHVRCSPMRCNGRISRTGRKRR